MPDFPTEPVFGNDHVNVVRDPTLFRSFLKLIPPVGNLGLDNLHIDICNLSGVGSYSSRMNRRRELASSALAMQISLWASSTALKCPLPFFRAVSIAALKRSSNSCPSLNRSAAALNSDSKAT